jgi:rusticyanin
MKRITIMKRIRPAAIRTAGAGLATAVGLAAAIGLAACASGTAVRHPTAEPSPLYSYYRSMMSRYHGHMMMGGPGNEMMGGAGYRWMTGAGGVPGWMHGGRLPGYMMGTSTDPGTIMGRFWAGAPGPRVSAAQAAKLGSQAPAGARVDRSARMITFSTTSVRLAVLASPAGGPDERFLIAGLMNPTLVIPAGARVFVEVINADPGMAHGMVITPSGAARSPMPMMTARPAFPGSALWFLGNATSAGMHVGTLAFTAATAGSYQYLCAVPGHARKGMAGKLIVSTSG